MDKLPSRLPQTPPPRRDAHTFQISMQLKSWLGKLFAVTTAAALLLAILFLSLFAIAVIAALLLAATIYAMYITSIHRRRRKA
jgi:Flp pilus assembly protein TadB